jgi:hypothetical protein
MHLADAGVRQGGGRQEREGGGDGQAFAHGSVPGWRRRRRVTADA